MRVTLNLGNGVRTLYNSINQPLPGATPRRECNLGKAIASWVQFPVGQNFELSGAIVPKTGTWVHSPEERIGADNHSISYKWSFLMVRDTNGFYLSCIIKNWSLNHNKKIIKYQAIWSPYLNFLSSLKQGVKENQSLAHLSLPDIICIVTEIAFFFWRGWHFMEYKNEIVTRSCVFNH